MPARWVLQVWRRRRRTSWPGRMKSLCMFERAARTHWHTGSLPPQLQHPGRGGRHYRRAPPADRGQVCLLFTTINPLCCQVLTPQQHGDGAAGDGSPPDRRAARRQCGNVSAAAAAAAASAAAADVYIRPSSATSRTSTLCSQRRWTSSSLCGPSLWSFSSGMWRVMCDV